ncbi:type VI secretion system ImpA family N-terminal domain-containing protein, partial [Methylobacterium trifolii]
MALSIDPAALTGPLSPDEPCGPDLEEAGDLDFLNGLAHAEGLLPSAFFSRDDEGRLQPFDRSSIDFGRETKALLALLARTRDVRILALLARLAMLDRDLAGFAGVLGAIATLLETCWADVHPRGEGGGFELRSAILQALDDVPTVILPLQHVALAQSRRHGAITFRSVMIADGEVAAREDESAPDRAGIERAADVIRAVAETFHDR